MFLISTDEKTSEFDLIFFKWSKFAFSLDAVEQFLSRERPGPHPCLTARVRHSSCG